jgi:TRAP-type mannitol/chloroaromatic compound transport system permease large subunit
VVLYGMIARQPVGQLWLAGVFPGLLMAGVFVLYIMVRCRLNPALAPTVKDEDLNMPMVEKLRLLRAGIVPFLIFFFMTGLFVFGYTSLVSSAGRHRRHAGCRHQVA